MFVLLSGDREDGTNQGLMAGSSVDGLRSTSAVLSISSRLIPLV
jgi:hypothetical protein